MILEQSHPMLVRIEQIFLPQIPATIALAIVFSVLTAFNSQVSSPGKVWWKNPAF